MGYGFNDVDITNGLCGIDSGEGDPYDEHSLNYFGIAPGDNLETVGHVFNFKTKIEDMPKYGYICQIEGKFCSKLKNLNGDIIEN